MKQQLDATPTNTKQEFLNKIGTWEFIIENSLGYYPIKYKTINGVIVKYEENIEKGDTDTIDTRYKRFNELEYAMTDLMTETEEAAYREQNQEFFKLLFTTNNPKAIEKAFNALLSLSTLISTSKGGALVEVNYSDAVKRAATVRENYYKTLGEKDCIGKSEIDLVLRYKRIYLLRKKNFHTALSFVLNSKTELKAVELDNLKVLLEKDVDYAFGSVDILINNAAVSRFSGAIDAISHEDWSRTLAVNLQGTAAAGNRVR